MPLELQIIYVCITFVAMYVAYKMGKQEGIEIGVAGLITQLVSKDCIRVVYNEDGDITELLPSRKKR